MKKDYELFNQLGRGAQVRRCFCMKDLAVHRSLPRCSSSIDVMMCCTVFPIRHPCTRTYDRSSMTVLPCVPVLADLILILSLVGCTGPKLHDVHPVDNRDDSCAGLLLTRGSGLPSLPASGGRAQGEAQGQHVVCGDQAGVSVDNV